jgi:hypothetical protein
MRKRRNLDNDQEYLLKKEPPFDRYFVGEDCDLVFCRKNEVKPVLKMIKNGASLEEIQEYLDRPIWEVLHLLIDLASKNKIKTLFISIDL